MPRRTSSRRPSSSPSPGAAETGFSLDLRDARSVRRATVELVGGKAFNLARLVGLALPTPSAVVLTTEAWRHFLDSSGLRKPLRKALAPVTHDSAADLERIAGEVAALIEEAPLPETLRHAVAAIYEDLSREGEVRLAVRSSGASEDSAKASFSGMLSTVLGVQDIDSTFKAVRKCWSSGFNTRSLRYHQRMGFKPASMMIAVVVQKMVKAESSGVLFTVDPATGDRDIAVLEAAFGYGTGVVSGDVSPDLYRIDKQKLEIVHRDHRPQQHYYNAGGRRRNVAPAKRQRAKLTDDEVRELVRYGLKAETGLNAPQDIEWCKSPDGLVLLQTRPVTGIERLSLRQKRYTRPEVVMMRGIGVSPRVGWGEVVKIDADALSPSKLAGMVKGKVVILRSLTQDLAPHLKDAAAVVADEGGATSHGANILREFEVPCLVGTRYASAVLSDGDVVTVDGWRGLVLDGIGPRVREREFGPEHLVTTKTKLMTTINMPESAEKAAGIADGVISLRNDYLLLQGGVHPARLLRRGKGETLTNAVFQALLIVARAFEDKPVWYKTLDAPTDDFRRLRGGEDEPLERNPLLGWRGIRRELDNPALLLAEYEAVRRAVEAGCRNIGIKVPFVRSVEEYEYARRIAQRAGLKPHEDVAFGASIETPGSALTIDAILAAGADFINVGINDLTMCCLGVDRDSERVAGLFDPAHPAVVRLLEEIAGRCRGKVFMAAAGDVAQYPELLEKLIDLNFDCVGISLPYLATARGQVARLEEKAG